MITGASQGIGKSLAELAAARGGKVLAVARSENLLKDLAAQVQAQGGVLHIVSGDITSLEDRKRMVEAAVGSFGGLDILINNAGIGATGHFVDASPHRPRKIL